MSDTYSQLIDLLDEDKQPAPIKPEVRSPVLVKEADLTTSDASIISGPVKLPDFSTKKAPLKPAGAPTHNRAEDNRPAEFYKANSPPIRSNISIRQKFTSVIRPDYKRRLKSLAYNRDCDPCDVLEDALTFYFDSLERSK